MGKPVAGDRRSETALPSRFGVPAGTGQVAALPRQPTLHRYIDVTVRPRKSEMSSAKLQVRPILLKKISFMIFFNNYLNDYETIRCHRKEKINKRFFLF